MKYRRKSTPNAPENVSGLIQMTGMGLDSPFFTSGLMFKFHVRLKWKDKKLPLYLANSCSCEKKWLYAWARDGYEIFFNLAVGPLLRIWLAGYDAIKRYEPRHEFPRS